MKTPSKLNGILSHLIKILILVPLIGVNGMMAYIMFAPDAWPKPFYLMYAMPPEPTSEESASTGTTHSSSSTVQEAHAAAPESEASATAGAPLQAPLEIRPGQGLMVDTGTKIVNLMDPTGRRYLRVGVVLEFAPTDLSYYVMTGEERTLFLETFNEEVSVILPVINDIIITTLSSQTFESVYTAEGKETLRTTILDTVNGQVHEQRVIFVYFTEFVVQ